MTDIDPTLETDHDLPGADLPETGDDVPEEIASDDDLEAEDEDDLDDEDMDDDATEESA